ncbi:Ig-like domain-containing protein [Vibrio breoganii]
MPNFNRHCLYALLSLSLIGCNSETTSNTDQASVFVPYKINELPKPNDGYGYDEETDGTISGIDEPAIGDVNAEAYYQDFNNSYAALDGWGLCAEPILIPLQAVDSEQRHPLNQASLQGNVVLMNSTGDEIPTKLSASGSEIKIECEASLESATTYHIVVTDGVKNENGEPLQADQSFTDLISSNIDDLPPEQQELRSQLDRAIAHAPNAGTPVYAAEFTTQDSYAVLDAMVETSLKQGEATFVDELTPVREFPKKDYFDQYRITLESPFYLPFTKEKELECVRDEYDLKAKCPALFEWITTEADEFPTHKDPVPKITDREHLETDIYVPEGWDGEELPTVIFVHGVTGDKGTVSTMLKDFTEDGYAVVAIDMPYHGTRIRYGKADQDNPEQEISARADKSYFINIDSPLALRSNLQQTVSDFISLRSALNGLHWVDQDNVHLVGLSLGGITSVMISEFSQNHAELAFKTVNFAVPGQGLTNLTLSSKTLGPEMSEGVKKSADVQRSIAETVIPDICTESAINEECILALNEFVKDSEENAIIVSQLEDDIWALIKPELLQGVQPTIDASDPASFTARQTENGQPTLLLEAIGNCGESCEVGEYLPDTVVPNSADNNIRTGTEPLIKALELSPITEEITYGNPIRGVVRLTTGGHGTYMFPYEGPMDESGLPSLPTGDVMQYVWDATYTQQALVASMVKSDAYQVEIENLEHIETEVAEDEK